MVSAWRAARIGKLIGLRGICARAIAGLLDDSQPAEMSPDQWLQALLPAIADGVAAIGRGTGHYEPRQARPPAVAATSLLPAGEEAEPGARRAPGPSGQLRMNGWKDLTSGSPTVVVTLSSSVLATTRPGWAQRHRRCFRDGVWADTRTAGGAPGDQLSSCSPTTASSPSPTVRRELRARSRSPGHARRGQLRRPATQRHTWAVPARPRRHG